MLVWLMALLICILISDVLGFLFLNIFISIYSFCYFWYLFIFFYEREKTFLSLTYSPNACSKQGWVSPKSGDQSSVWVSHIGVRDSNTWAITTDRECVSNKLEVKHPRLQLGTWIWHLGAPSSILIAMPSTCPLFTWISLIDRHWEWVSQPCVVLLWCISI